MAASASIHASCVLAGAGAVLIRGASGSGKSRLALALLQAAQAGAVPFARLVADDRTLIEVAHGRLLARPPAELAGLLEIRGLGISTLPFEPVALVVLVVDLGEAADRLPSAKDQMVEVSGITLPRLAVPPGAEPLPLVLARLIGLAA
jgi:serine kinase of HPr protein (carbohydrate metabolism regulator)